jgi:hypothetical protein
VFTSEAKERHGAAQRRVLDHFGNGEQAIGVNAWMDAQERGTAEEEAEDRASEEAGDDPEEGFEFDFVNKDVSGVGGEEGPVSPPGTPVEGSPPAMHKPPAYAETDPGGTTNSRPTSRSPVPKPKARHTKAKAQAVDAPPTGTAASAGAGLSGYFTNTLPRKWTLTGLIAGSPPLPVPAPPQINPTSEERRAGPVEGSFGSAMVALSSSLPRPPQQPHAGSSHGGSTSNVRGGGKGGPQLDAYLTHTTPFGSTPYIPPTGAPGFEGDHQWDKGGFAEEWEREQTQKEHGKVMKGKGVHLFGRNEMTAGVLTTELAYSVCLFFLLSALALICVVDQERITPSRSAFGLVAASLFDRPAWDIFAYAVYTL